MYQEAARYKALYECGHIGILTLNRSGEIQDGNPAFRALSGYGEEEDLSLVEYAQLFEKADRAEALEKIRQLSEGGSAIREELRTLRMKDGSTRTVSTEGRIATLNFSRAVRPPSHGCVSVYPRGRVPGCQPSPG